MLVVSDFEYVSPEGNEYGDDHLVLFEVDATDRICRIEQFLGADHAAALTRLHELGHPTRSGPVLENEAVRRGRRFVTACNAGDEDEVASAPRARVRAGRPPAHGVE